MKKIEELQRQLSEGRLSRRDFISRATALGLAAAIPGTILMEEAKAAAPKRGGRGRFGLTGGATSDLLDPGQLLDTHNIMVSFGSCRNCLTEISNEGKLIGELAESWEASSAADIWRFELRKGVEFHNGKTLEAEDVVYSLNRHRGKDSKSAASGLVENVTDVKADGKNAVICTLSGGSADFPLIMTDYHLSIVPNGTEGADLEKAEGTGGYVLEEWEPGVRGYLTRFPNYWKDGAAHFDELEILAISDTSARTNALRTGEIDVMNNVELKTARLLKKSPHINVIVTTGTKHMTIPMDTRKAPFSDNNVRMALKHAIDRNALVKTILRGYGVVGNDFPIAKANIYHATEEDIPQRHYDPDKAKYYLKQAGMDSLKVKLSAAETAFNGAVDAAVLYREQALKAGIDIEVVREPDDGYWSNVWMKKPWVMCYWGGRPSEDWMFSQVYAEGANWNDTFWSNKRFNELLIQARAELNTKKRRALYVEMQLIVRDEGGVVIPMFASAVAGTSDKVAHREAMAGNWELDGNKATERWWFA